MQNVLSNYGELTTRRYLKNAGSIGWVLIWWIWWLSDYYLYKRIYHLHYSNCASCKSMSLLDEQSLLSLVLLLLCSLSPLRFMCIITLSMTYETTLSLSKYSFWIFSTCFPYPCSLSFVTSHTKSLVAISGGVYSLSCFQARVSLI